MLFLPEITLPNDRFVVPSLARGVWIVQNLVFMLSGLATWQDKFGQIVQLGIFSLILMVLPLEVCVFSPSLLFLWASWKFFAVWFGVLFGGVEIF